MVNHPTSLVFIKTQLSFWYSSAAFLAVTVYVVFKGVSDSWSLGIWLGCTGILLACWIPHIIEGITKVGIEFAGDTFRIQVYNPIDKDYISEFIHLSEYRELRASGLYFRVGCFKLNNEKYLKISAPLSKCYEINKMIQQRISSRYSGKDST